MWEQILDFIVQTPHLGGIEPELRLAVRAVGHFIRAILVFSIAVIPEPDGVEIFQQTVRVRLLEALGELLRVAGNAGGVGFDVV